PLAFVKSSDGPRVGTDTHCTLPIKASCPTDGRSVAGDYFVSLKQKSKTLPVPLLGASGIERFGLTADDCVEEARVEKHVEAYRQLFPFAFRSRAGDAVVDTLDLKVEVLRQCQCLVDRQRRTRARYGADEAGIAHRRAEPVADRRDEAGSVDAML